MISGVRCIREYNANWRSFCQGRWVNRLRLASVSIFWLWWSQYSLYRRWPLIFLNVWRNEYNLFVLIQYMDFSQVGWIKENIKVTRHRPFCVGHSPGTVNSQHKWPGTRKIFPFDDVIMNRLSCGGNLNRIKKAHFTTGTLWTSLFEVKLTTCK